ncbi:hypothetical protein PRVXT_002609 [Proteinivorax tanatarense]|uniref:Uncharacterized protein n=1 Tax=Proteinivorax tanatarense TaxID=1260629 RepID=A0AAU7VL94_9FIRM
MQKKILKFVLLLGIGYVLLTLINWQQNEIREIAGSTYEVPILNIIFLKTLVILFGVLIEWRRVLKLFKEGFSVDISLLVLSCILIIISIIPQNLWFEWVSIATYGPAKILQGALSNYLINVAAGIVLMRSLVKD